MSVEIKPAANIKYINIKMKKKLKNNSEIIYIIKDAGELCVKILLFLLCCENLEKIDFEFMKNNVKPESADDDEILNAVEFWKNKNILDYEITSLPNVKGPNMDNIMNIILNISRDINIINGGKSVETEEFDEGLGIYNKKYNAEKLKKYIEIEIETETEETPEPAELESEPEEVTFEFEEPEKPETREIIPPQDNQAPRQTGQSVSIAKLIDVYETKDEFRRLVYEAQVKMQTTFNMSELVIMYNLYEINRMEAGVILKLVEICVEEDKNNIRYLEKYALAMAANGILTMAEYENKIKERQKIIEFEEKIRRLFDAGDKKFTPKEKSFIKRWVKEFNFTDDVLLEGYKRVMKYKGKLLLDYINTIYTDWHQKGFKTLEDVKNEFGTNNGGFTYGGNSGSRKNTGMNMDDILEKAVKKGVK